LDRKQSPEERKKQIEQLGKVRKPVTAPSDNPVINAVVDRLMKQQEKGYAKYGRYVQVDALSLLQWIEHAQEEMTDQLIYLECVKQKLEGSLDEQLANENYDERKQMTLEDQLDREEPMRIAELARARMAKENYTPFGSVFTAWTPRDWQLNNR
jgi:hypothetical protein